MRLLTFILISPLTIVTAATSPNVNNGKISESAIYDITSIIHETNRSGNASVMGSALKNLFREDDVPLHYRMGEGINETHLLAGAMKLIHRYLRKNSTLIISIRDKKALEGLTSLLGHSSKMAGITGVIIDATDCPETAVFELDHIKGFKMHNVKIGLKLSASEGIIEQRCLRKGLIEAVDTVVVSVPFITQIQFPESYHIFRNYMQYLEKETLKLINGIYPKVDLLFYLQLDSFSEGKTPPETDLDYNLLFDRFANRWVKESRPSVIMQLSNYSYYERLGMPVMSIERELNSQSKLILPLAFDAETYRTLNVRKTKEILSSHFDSILICSDAWKVWNASLDVIKLFKGNSDEPLDRILKIFKTAKDLKSYAEDVEKYSKTIQENECHPGPLNDLKRLNGIPDTALKCDLEMVTWKYTFQLEELYGYDHHPHNYTFQVQRELNKMLIKRKENSSITLLMLDVGNLTVVENRIVRNFYCNSKLQMINGYIESIANWARIHSFPVILQEILDVNHNDSSFSPGWLSQVEPTHEISKRVRKDFPHFVMRNYPDKIINRKVDPCVHWTEDVPEGGIVLDKDYSGISISMNIRNDSLKMDELENMLMFSLKQFKTVELLPRTGESQLIDLLTLKSLLLTPEFLDDLEIFEILNGRLYIQVSVEGHDLPSVLEEITQIAQSISTGHQSGLKLAGLHLSHWETLKALEVVVTDAVALGKQYGFQIGLVIQNCSKLLNNLVEDSSQLIFPHTDYILCSTNVFPAYNDDQRSMATHLDTNLYISSVFTQLRSNLSVYFRLNSFPCCAETDNERTKNLFRFLNDVNQFAVGNQLKHFLVQALTMTSDSFNSSSWFRVETFTDLSDPSVFIVRENELLNQTTWRPSAPTRKTPMMSVFPALVLLGLAAAGILQLLCVVLQSWNCKQAENQNTNKIPCQENVPFIATK